MQLQQTQILVDGMTTHINDIELPAFNPDGSPKMDGPVQATVKIRQLTLVVEQPPPSQFVIHIRFTPQAFESWIADISGQRVAVASGQDLANLVARMNGGN
jgi:hypothetical protein